MDRRCAELSEISSYIRNIDNEVTLILQSFQWDRNHLLESPSLALCKYDHNHRVPPDKLRLHEEGCRLRSLGYSADELLLPDPLDVNANTLVTLSKSDIADILDAANINPLKKDRRCAEPEPLSLQRLQVAYSWEERRAIHDAVVGAAPACHDLTDLALPSNSGDGEQPAPKPRSRLEILAELRDMKRRRTKYRVPPKTRNYSDVLRDVISTQMEHFSEIHKEANPVFNHSKSHKISIDNPDKTKEAHFKNHDEVHIKKEPIDIDNYSEERYRRKRDRSKERFKESEKRHDDYKIRHNDERDRYSSSSKDRSRTEYKSSDKHRKDEKDYRSDDKYRKEGKDYRSSEKYRKEDHYYRSGEKYRKEGHDYKSGEKYRKEDHDYRSSEKYRKEDKYYRGDYKDHSSKKSSRTSDDKYKRERDSHKSHRDEHRRYYDSKEDECESIRKRIKQEKD